MTCSGLHADDPMLLLNPSLNQAWLLLVVAGLLEVVWASA